MAPALPHEVDITDGVKDRSGRERLYIRLSFEVMRKNERTIRILCGQPLLLGLA